MMPLMTQLVPDEQSGLWTCACPTSEWMLAYDAVDTGPESQQFFLLEKLKLAMPARQPPRIRGLLRCGVRTVRIEC